MLRNVPMDPAVDFAGLLKKAGIKGALDPNSIEVWNLATKKRRPHALSDDFAHGDNGRVEFVIGNPRHTRYEIRFRTVAHRPPLKPQAYVPAIGVGDLLRYNAGRPRPITLFHSMGLHDLNRDGRRDLVGAWTYAYRPGRPWDGVICYPRVGKKGSLEFGDLTRLRYAEKPGVSTPKHFRHIYMAADFADFNRDGLIDLVVTRRGTNTAGFYLSSGTRDRGGMPIFQPAGSVKVSGWAACRAVDLNGDGAVDLVVDGQFVKNGNPKGWPFVATKPVNLAAGRSPCFLDLDLDGRKDVVCLKDSKEARPNFYRVAWRKNFGGDPPKFGKETLLKDIHAPLCSSVSSYRDKTESGLIVQHDAFQQVSFFKLRRRHSGKPRFDRTGRAQSLSAVMSLSDQAWPCLCDWDDDGDHDLLIGGGYGWPRIVINEGTRTRPAYAEPKPILAEGKPIRFLRNQILGDPSNWHNMGYPYPVFVDWDGDGLRDLVCPNETNRIFWYKNIGKRRKPRFGRRRQILCDGYPDSPELRAKSAGRANDRKSKDGVYPYEKERPFRWRTGAAFADWNGDGLMDFVTDDGQTGVATLFVQYRDKLGALRLRKDRVLKLVDGSAIDYPIVKRRSRWTEAFRAVDWDQDGKMDLLYSLAGSHHGIQDGGSIYLLRNTGTRTSPRFARPRTMRCFGQPIRITNHGPHPWAGDFDGDGKPDLITCVEWSVYPYYSHSALQMKERPKYELGACERVSPR